MFDIEGEALLIVNTLVSYGYCSAKLSTCFSYVLTLGTGQISAVSFLVQKESLYIKITKSYSVYRYKMILLILMVTFVFVM